ncbi:hypothetical protein VUR80DRAFT_3574 [Thermomyces stellatus]
MHRHTLGDSQKRAYLDAQKCVMQKPGSLGLPGARTKFEEMASNHQILGRTIHATGAFFPYHRYLLHAHELLLKECGYSDGIPYWDIPRDAGHFSTADIFDAELGFGTAAKDFNCVTDGPFANTTCPIGPGFRLKERCMARNVSDARSLWSTQERVDSCMVHDKFEDLDPCLYMVPHRGGHGGVGGTMRDPLASPGDPIFYLHHAWVDKLWSDWQEADPKKRTYDIGGPNAQTSDVGFPEVPGNMEEENEKVFGEMNEEQKRFAHAGTEGDGGGEMTLRHVLTTLGVIPDITVEDVMDTRGGYLCYEQLSGCVWIPVYGPSLIPGDESNDVRGTDVERDIVESTDL